MKSVPALLMLLLAGFHLTAPLAGQIIFQRPPTQEVLKRWADPDTVQAWAKAIRIGRDALRQGRLDEAEASFRAAILACERKASGRVQQCIPRLLLAEVLLDSGNIEEAMIQVNQTVMSLKKATRPVDSGKPDDPGKVLEDLVANIYRYQVGAALYMRSARIYVRLGLPERAAPLFRSATRVFDQRTLQQPYIPLVLDGLQFEFPHYRLRPFRVAEILEAQCRYQLFIGRDDQGLNSLRDAEKARKMPLPNGPYASPANQTELLLDQLVAEPLDKSLLKRFLEDCAFYRFDDARIADLLVRQAALLRKVGRADEATAFERFAESLRRRPATP